MDKKLAAKIAKLPATPGVYYFKNANSEIIYVGKASRLRPRVRSYFQVSRPRDTKTSLLIADIADIDWQELETEDDALFLEAEMVRRYRPHYNILLRDDKSSQFVRIDYKSEYPTVRLVRRPLPDNAEYFGPFTNGYALRLSLKYLRRAFPYATTLPSGHRVSLHYHLGLDPGLEEGKTDLLEYRKNLRKLMRYLRGGRAAIIKELEKDMKRHAANSQFEKAARSRDQLHALKDLSRQKLLSSTELAEANRDHGLTMLANLLGLALPLKRIEGFDISHIQGSDTTASMVVFTLGVPDKTAYRKFKMRLPGNDDFAHMAEAINRRLSPTNVKKWGTPDLILVDGGRGQLSASTKARDLADWHKIPIIGIAKNEEALIIQNTGSLPDAHSKDILARAVKLGAYTSESEQFINIILPKISPALKLIQRIRDESHRFALSYHGSLRRKRTTSSLLTELPGVGPATHRKLVRHFGSIRGAKLAGSKDLQKLLGPSMGKRIFDYFRSQA